jgi:hypothetical protein
MDSNVVSLVDTVFSYGRLVQMLQSVVPLIFLQFGVHGTACLDNTEMDLSEIRGSNVDWIGQAKDRDMWRALVNAVGCHICREIPDCLQNQWCLEQCSAP